MSDALQDRETSSENHKRFLERVLERREVWGLRTDDGWAICDSNETDDAQVMPFWSDRAYAKRAAREDWAHYEPTSIPLDVFIERWLKGMHDDGVLVGTNWDVQNSGLEVAAADLARQLTGT
jgi:hypothetical protein